ncbi:hypothetical protein EVAR_8452_1 [Eumeta japonica]|uniref:Uncharacterized protein n=1 Tax=Eumeta variegata TaxID=151549 RepID=A0A4C1WCR6_EUMVA|nr:hypothetical protein EVAR_8452_1 [Eumeta japonica]
MGDGRRRDAATNIIAARSSSYSGHSFPWPGRPPPTDGPGCRRGLDAVGRMRSGAPPNGPLNVDHARKAPSKAPLPQTNSVNLKRLSRYRYDSELRQGVRINAGPQSGERAHENSRTVALATFSTQLCRTVRYILQTTPVAGPRGAGRFVPFADPRTAPPRRPSAEARGRNLIIKWTGFFFCVRFCKHTVLFATLNDDNVVS